jgi:hypothetical protein
MTAALNCNLNQVTMLLQQGADVKAVDAEGNDALTVASQQRTMDKKQGFLLECPEVVSALVKAGANPEDAKVFQSPQLELHQPKKIAVLRVQDDRENKFDNAKVMEQLTEGVEQALSQKIPRITPVITPHYPIQKLKDTREKLKAAGFSDEDVLRPDRERACSVLDVDSVFEARLKDYSHGAFFNGSILGSKSGANLELALTDCRTKQLVWRAVGTSSEARGFIVKAFINGYTVLCEQLMTMPRYRESEK